MARGQHIHYHRRKIVVLAVFLQTCIVFCQPSISFRHLSVKDGLSQNSVISIAQDSTGYLWLATQDGLNKYDGRRFDVFNYYFVDITKPTYSHLGKVYVDREGGIWIIPISEIPHVYDGKTNSFLPFSAVSGVSIIFQDKNLTTWFGTYTQGLFKKEKYSQEVQQVLNADDVKVIFTITEAPNGDIWLGCENKIISITAGTRTVREYFPNGDKTKKINYSSLLFSYPGDLWVGSYGNGIWHKGKNSDFQRVEIDSSAAITLPNDLYVTSMFLRKENIWIATYGDGLYQLDLRTRGLTHFSANKYRPGALHYNDILCIFEDYTGTLWFGTDGGGASYYDEYLEKFNYFTNHQTPEGIDIEVVRSIIKDAENNIWIGTSGKGLTKYSPQKGTWKTYKASLNSSGLSSNRIMSLHMDADHDLWIGTQDGGLNIMRENEELIRYNSNSAVSLPAVCIWDIFEDKEANIWLATRENGLIKFDKKKGVLKAYTKKEAKNSLPSDNIRVIAQGAENSLWLGTENNGISHFYPKTGKFVNYQKTAEGDHSLGSNHIKSLYYAGNKILWIGTNGGGLTAFNVENKTFYTYSMEDGLPNKVIYAILPDEDHNLWLSSNKGITKFTPSTNLRDRPKITNYYNYDGLATEFDTGAYFKAANGDLYFGALNGIYWFDPSHIKKMTTVPKTSITGFAVLNEAYPLENNVVLKSDQNTLSFSFSSLQFSLPQKNQYQYKLKSHEKNWVRSGNRNYARYTNLPAGDYEFLVKSSNYDGVWNEEPVSFRFSILNPWYLSNLAIVIYFLLLLTGLLLIYKYLKWRWQMQHKLKTKQEEANRLKELDEYKTQLYTNLSHEFRTPLTLITAPIRKQLQNQELKEEVKEDLQFVAHNTSRLLILADQLMELSKLESGAMKLKVQKGRLDVLLNSIHESFLHLAIQKKLQLSSSIAPLEDAWFDADAMEKIVNNLLGNAIKYTSSEGNIMFEVKNNHDREVYMAFTNDISEIKEKHTSGLFDRFYQSDSNSRGFGIGLSLVKELVSLSHGNIQAFYPNGRSIKFVLRIPINKAAFSQEELNTSHENMALEDVSADFSSTVPKGAIILIVEDDRNMRKFIISLLHKNYKIIEAENGREGIEKALKIIPDLIISDVMMPKGTGTELCKCLKEDERTSHIPIILLTAGMGDEHEIMGIKTGADDYITKPFHPERLIIRVQKLIELREKLRDRYRQDIFLLPKDIAVTSVDEHFWHGVQKILDTQLVEPGFTAEKFSQQVGMSRMQLHRKLIALTGLSATAFIRSQRLKIAVDLLRKNDITIAEAAYSSGFNTPSYFTKCFREVYKKSPLEYIKTL